MVNSSRRSRSTRSGTFVSAAKLLDEHDLSDADCLSRIRLASAAAVIIQGRWDSVCPAKTAWDLHRAWPEAKFVMVPDAGHSANEPGIEKALLEATAEFAKLS